MSSHAGRPSSRLYEIRIRDIWKWLIKQPGSFWFINIYLFFEYVRPQQIYKAIDIVPWAWAAIWLALLCFAIEGFKTRRFYPADFMLGLFCAIILLSSAAAQYPHYSVQQLSLFFSWVLIYGLITNIVNNEDRFFVFTLAFLLYSTKMSQHGTQAFIGRGGGFEAVGASGAPGWFQNSGEFGIQMCIFLPLSVYFIQALRPYWSRRKLWLFLLMPITAALSIIASSSRGALIGLVPVLLWMLAKSRKPLKALVLVTVFSALIWVLVPDRQRERLSEMGSDETSESRIAFWKLGLKMMGDYPLTGVGYGNWLAVNYRDYGAAYYFEDSGKALIQLPHNVFIQAGAELGYTGLLIYLGLIGTFLYTNHKTRQAAKRLGAAGNFSVAMAHGLDAGLMGFIAGGFFVTVLYYPFFWIGYAMTVALHHSVVNRAQPLPTPQARVPVPQNRIRVYGRT